MIRLATSKDEAEVLKLLDVLGDELSSKRGYSPANHEAVEKGGLIFKDVVSRKDTLIFVYEEDSKIVGLITFYVLPSIRHGNYRGHIEDVVVEKSQRNKGIASQLMNEVKQYCRVQGIRVIKLDSGNELEDAHKYYLKNGGKQTEKMFRFDIE